MIHCWVLRENRLSLDDKGALESNLITEINNFNKTNIPRNSKEKKFLIFERSFKNEKNRCQSI